MSNTFYKFQEDGFSFSSNKATSLRKIYFPLCGVDATGIKSSITPFLSGDIKVDKNSYITKPVSTEDLRFPLRNFFVFIEGKGVCSFNDINNVEDASVEAGLLWHKVARKNNQLGLQLESLNFVPVTGEDIEIMQVTVKNLTDQEIVFTPTASVPLFARALENKHDHEHVTSLLHRTEQLKEGVCVSPVMLFNEEGHKNCETVYCVFGCEDLGDLPVGTFPTADSFYGDQGSNIYPEAVYKNLLSKKLPKDELNGKEAVGALRFKKASLKSGEEKQYFILIGKADSQKQALEEFHCFNTHEKIQQALLENKKFWTDKSKAITFETSDDNFNAWMHWVTLQPVLRRIYGCSFLPDHDYGKGGKGWRDIWQDLLSLILIEPGEVAQTLINNFAGIRIDGSNATIIGAKPGEFIADRNAITRVWMDHGVWPFMTLLLYINQTGDIDILFKNNTYFKDLQLSRTLKKDDTWERSKGNELKTKDGKIYQGTLLEHILVQLLVQFFNVGEHNITRLESADWNDGFDMGFDKGESVCFMSLYGGNLLKLADLLQRIGELKKIKKVSLAKELTILLDRVSEKKTNYDDIDAKKKTLFEDYYGAVEPQLSGEKVDVDLAKLCDDLRQKGNWIFEHIQKQEWITVGKNSWFNGYYDNVAQRVEGEKDSNVRMTLTGQVFPIMSGLASDDEIKAVVASVRKYLKDKDLGGFRLNSDFGLRNYLDLGRAFGFAYGTKENGAFFSHMIVMYANALYQRGFAKEGREVLKSIYDMCMDTDKSKIYPGIPEYMDSEGLGMYHYLTGSASWFVLTQLRNVFGISSEVGDLVLYPQLVKEEFKADGTAKVSCSFASKKLKVTYQNKSLIDVGSYKIQAISLNDKPIEYQLIDSSKAKINRSLLEKEGDVINLNVELG